MDHANHWSNRDHPASATTKGNTLPKYQSRQHRTENVRRWLLVATVMWRQDQSMELVFQRHIRIYTDTYVCMCVCYLEASSTGAGALLRLPPGKCGNPPIESEAPPLLPHPLRSPLLRGRARRPGGVRPFPLGRHRTNNIQKNHRPRNLRIASGTDRRKICPGAGEDFTWRERIFILIFSLFPV